MALGGKFFPACGLNRRDGTGFEFRMNESIFVPEFIQG